MAHAKIDPFFEEVGNFLECPQRSACGIFVSGTHYVRRSVFGKTPGEATDAAKAEAEAAAEVEANDWIDSQKCAFRCRTRSVSKPISSEEYWPPLPNDSGDEGFTPFDRRQGYRAFVKATWDARVACEPPSVGAETRF